MNDVEDLLNSVRGHLIDNLNTTIGEMNDEKNADGLSFNIDTIEADTKHYLIAGRYRELPNFDFVNVELAGAPELETNFGDFKMKTPILVEVVIPNTKNETSYYRSLRYMRAIMETMAAYEAPEIGSGGLELTGAVPADIIVNRRELYTSGVVFAVTLG